MANGSWHYVWLVVEPAGVALAGLVLLFLLYCNPGLIMGFISTFILPKDVDFDTALQAQARLTRIIVKDLHNAVSIMT